MIKRVKRRHMGSDNNNLLRSKSFTDPLARMLKHKNLLIRNNSLSLKTFRVSWKEKTEQYITILNTRFDKLSENPKTKPAQ